MDERFKFFDRKSRIMTSFDTLPLDVDFGHLLTGSNFLSHGTPTNTLNNDPASEDY